MNKSQLENGRPIDTMTAREYAKFIADERATAEREIARAMTAFQQATGTRITSASFDSPMFTVESGATIAPAPRITLTVAMDEGALL